MARTAIPRSGSWGHSLDRTRDAFALAAGGEASDRGDRVKKDPR